MRLLQASRRIIEYAILDGVPVKIAKRNQGKSIAYVPERLIEYLINSFQVNKKCQS